MSLRVHFIWIGDPIPITYLNNVIKWKELNPDFEFILWIDSRLLPADADIDEYFDYIADQKIDIRDINEENIWDQNIPYIRVLRNAYEMEIGLKKRPFFNLKVPLRNYGLATDILRLIILYKYGGYYIDVDITPVNLNNVNPCPLHLCFSVMYGSLSNAVIYYDGSLESEKAIRDLFRTIGKDLLKLYKERYLDYFYNWEQETLNTTGPLAINKGTSKYQGKEFPNNLFLEDSRLGEEHTWFPKLDRLIDVFTYIYKDKNVKEALRKRRLQKIIPVIETQLNIDTVKQLLNKAVNEDDQIKIKKYQDILNKKLNVVETPGADPRPAMKESERDDEDLVEIIKETLMKYHQLKDKNNISFLRDDFIDKMTQVISRDVPNKKNQIEAELKQQFSNLNTINESNRNDVIKTLEDISKKYLNKK